MGEHDEQTPLFTDETLKRTGSFRTAVAHIITALIGSGVLSLAWSIAQLGWIAGPFSMIIFAAITVVSSYLLCDCYRSPDPEHGLTRNISYMDAVKANLENQVDFVGEGRKDSNKVFGEINWGSSLPGRKSIWVSALFQQVSLYFLILDGSPYLNHLLINLFS